MILALDGGHAGQPPGFFECTVELRLYCGRTLRPIGQSSGEAVLRARSGRRLNVQAINPDRGASEEFVLLDVCVGPYYHGLDPDVEIELRSAGFNERDRAFGVASPRILQNGNDPRSTDLAHRDRTCHCVTRTASDE